TDFNIGYAQDELRYSVRRDLFLQPAVETLTMRNDPSQTALPMRDFGSFLPGNGVGGAGVHWNGHTWRFWDSDFQIKTNLTKRYGAARIADLQVEDWGVTGAEM
ncbi:GMC family oxidoreductase, partial [Mesorhizobium sp. M2E.F.Ca.ET.154.01.1.1]